jgi:Glycosyltransferase family 87
MSEGVRRVNARPMRLSLPNVPVGTPRPEAGRISLGWLVVAAAVVWHLLMVLRPGPEPGQAGSAFATQYYAAQVAWEGGDPYELGAVESVAAADARSRPLRAVSASPPVLLLTAPLLPLGQRAASVGWLVLQEFALFAALWRVVRTWRPLEEPQQRPGLLLPLVAALVGLSYAVTLATSYGQPHALALALAFAAATEVEQRPGRAGVWLGLAAAVDLGALLFAALWFSHGRWRSLAAAVLTFLGAAILALPLVGWVHQLSYFSEWGTLAAAARPSQTFGDLSLLHLWSRVFPGDRGELTLVARVLTGLSVFTVLSGTFLAFRAPPRDRVQHAAQTSLLLILPAIVAVRSDETDLVFALPALALVLLAVHRGWLRARWVLPLALALGVLTYEQRAIEVFAVRVTTTREPVWFLLIEELKLAALLVVAAAALRLGAAASDPSRAPSPVHAPRS